MSYPDKREEYGVSPVNENLTPKGKPAAIGLSIVDVVKLVIRHWRFIVVSGVTAVALAVTFVLTSNRTYTSSVEFTPTAETDGAGAISGLAAQFGVRVSTRSATESPAFYGGLIHSRNVLTAAVQTEYNVEVADTIAQADLVSFLEVDGETPEERVERAARKLEDRMSVRVNQETGVVSLSVTTNSADLSHQVTARFLELINAYNAERRRSRASDERSFVEQRLAEARTELATAEGELESFLTRNRQYENSPELVFQHARLTRNVRLKEEVVSSLAQAYEQARIGEVRNTPVITVVDPPYRPARPDRRMLLLKSGLALMAGIVLGFIYAIGRELFRRSAIRAPVFRFLHRTRLQQE